MLVWNIAGRSANFKVLEMGAGTTDADVALLCEAPSFEAISWGSVQTNGTTGGRDGYHRPWATTIASRHGLRRIDDAVANRRGRPLPLPFVNSRPGSWEAGVVARPGLDDVTLICLYGLLDEKSDASVHRSLSELTPVFEDRRYNQRILIGGDLNVLANPRTSDPAHGRHLTVLDRIKAFGFVDCLERRRPTGPLENCPCGLGDGCRHTWTFRDPRHPGTPYQDDYLFASKTLAKRLVDCRALGFLPSSDHAPVVAEFDV